MPTKEEKARELGIPTSSKSDYRCPCPDCSPRRKKKKDPCLHVTVSREDIRYYCWHCHEFKGVLEDDRDERSGHGVARSQGSGRRAGQQDGRGQPRKRFW